MKGHRIVIINDRSTAMGGATSLALLSARQLAEAGHEIIYVSGDDGDHAELPDNIELIALGGKALLERPFPVNIAKGLYDRSVFNKVRELTQKLHGPRTVFHLHGWAQTLSPSVLHALVPVQDRLVIHAHDFFHACPNGTFFNFQREAVCNLQPLGPRCLTTNCDKRNIGQKAFRLTRMALKRQLLDLGRTDAIVAIIHPYMADWLVKSGVDRARIRVLRNPVQPFTTRRVEAERNSDLFFIGRVEPEKGADLAAEAARRVGRRLRVVGDGSHASELAAKYPEVVLEGWSSHEKIGQLIRDARALVMPSRLPEPFGLVALEALQSGIPLVAFADSFVAREASDLGCAFVAPTRSAEGLAQAVREVDNDIAVAQASRTAMEVCQGLANTPENWRDQLVTLYDELLKDHSAIVDHTCSIAAPLVESAEIATS